MKYQQQTRIRKNRLARSVARALLGTALVAAGMTSVVAPALADSDERTIVGSTTSYPWKDVAKVRIGSAGNGRGSAVMVGSCVALTAAHVVYNYGDGDFRPIYNIAPGSYYNNSTSSVVNPYGTKTPVSLATNTGYTSTGKRKYDYGAIFVSSSFGLGSYMPVTFGSNPSYVNVAGYPSEDLPSSASGAAHEQWFGHGDKKSKTTRKIKYEASSSGGQSGGPVWVYNSSSGTRKLIAINVAHHNSDLDGTGVRMISANESLISSWMSDSCSRSSRAAQPSLSFANLVASRVALDGSPIDIVDAQELNVVSAPADFSDLTPVTRTYQWIEGQFYAWETFVDAQATAKRAFSEEAPVSEQPPRFIRLIKPESRALSAEEASVLLSASRLWMQQDFDRAPEFEPAPTKTYAVMPPSEVGEESETLVEQAVFSTGNPINK